MNYYIKGDAANADKIKAAFEKLGVTKFYGWTCSGIEYIFLSKDNELTAVQYDEDTIHILKTHPDYQELELPVEPIFKVGQLIYCPTTSDQLYIGEITDKDYIATDGRIVHIKDQEYWELWKDIEPQPKFKVGDLVVYRDTLGRVEECKPSSLGAMYIVGQFNVIEDALRLADHRDITRIVKGGQK